MDLPEHEYKFPQDVATTDSRPDMVIWSEDSIVLVELTIPFEEGWRLPLRGKGQSTLTCWPDVPLPDVLLTSLQSRYIGSKGFIDAST